MKGSKRQHKKDQLKRGINGITLNKWLRTFRRKGYSAIKYINDGAVYEKSYSDMLHDIILLSRYFKNQPYERYAICSKNSYGYICSIFAIELANKNAILIDATLTAANAKQLADIADYDFLLCNKDDIEKYSECFDNIAAIEDIMPDSNNVLSNEDYNIINNNNRTNGTLIIFTSGTSHLAKAVLLNFEKFVKNMFTTRDYCPGGKFDNVFVPLPLHHIFGLVRTLGCLMRDETICFGEGFKTIKRDVNLLNPHSYTLVNTLLEFMIKMRAFSPNTKYIIIGGSPCETELTKIIQSKGYYLHNVYGLSELGGTVAISKANDDPTYLTIRKGYADIFITDEGEVAVKYEYMFEGYYNNQEATNEAVKDNIFYTGDMGVITADNKLRITGRIKDMIILKNGEKIFCPEVDADISALEHIVEAAVIYEKDALTAVVVPEPDADEDIINEVIMSYNNTQPIIRQIAKVTIRHTPLPRTAIGKLQRRKLVTE
ncbi:MAG: acyl--CoA ligase [Lachnospiraceae bacterium]|nr:acyl--CoA ligase [Lachnospiraceae bacterium]